MKLTVVVGHRPKAKTFVCKPASPYLDSNVSVSEDHIEVLICHTKLFPQLCDQILVHQVLLTKTLHRLVIFWRKKRQW